MHRYAQGLYLINKKFIDTPNSLFLDLDSPATHLGDRLFIVRFVRICNESNIKILISEEDKTTREIFKSLGLQFEIANHQMYDLRMYFLPSINLNTKFTNKDLIVSFVEFSGVNLTDHLVATVLRRSPTNTPGWPPMIQASIEQNKQVVLFSPYVNSGFFRFIPRQQNILKGAVESFASQNNEIWLVGSAADSSAIDDLLPEHILDKRGQLTFSDIVRLFEQNKILMIIGFDNFFMHLAELYGVPSFIKFRGRLLHKNRLLHYETINVACSENKSKITYIDEESKIK